MIKMIKRVQVLWYLNKDDLENYCLDFKPYQSHKLDGYEIYDVDEDLIYDLCDRDPDRLEPVGYFKNKKEIENYLKEHITNNEYDLEIGSPELNSKISDAIDTIVKEMENNREDTVVIFAGYPDQMEDFLNRNPGMNSRIAFKINFDDYSVDELMEITRFMLLKEQMTISDPAFEKLRRIYEKAVKIPDYGNGRFVRKILEQAEMDLSDRVMDLGNEEITPEMLGRIEECDITDITPGIKTSERHIGFTAD